MYNPAKGSKPEQVLPDVDDPKVNWVSRGNFMSKVHSAMVFLDGS
jgi:hypothetical protein